MIYIYGAAKLRQVMPSHGTVPGDSVMCKKRRSVGGRLIVDYWIGDVLQVGL